MRTPIDGLHRRIDSFPLAQTRVKPLIRAQGKRITQNGEQTQTSKRAGRKLGCTRTDGRKRHPEASSLRAAQRPYGRERTLARTRAGSSMPMGLSTAWRGMVWRGSSFVPWLRISNSGHAGRVGAQRARAVVGLGEEGPDPERPRRRSRLVFVCVAVAPRLTIDRQRRSIKPCWVKFQEESKTNGAPPSSRFQRFSIQSIQL